jgi:hypothetical protein
VKEFSHFPEIKSTTTILPTRSKVGENITPKLSQVQQSSKPKRMKFIEVNAESDDSQGFSQDDFQRDKLHFIDSILKGQKQRACSSSPSTSTATLQEQQVIINKKRPLEGDDESTQLRRVKPNLDDGEIKGNDL